MSVIAGSVWITLAFQICSCSPAAPSMGDSVIVKALETSVSNRSAIWERSGTVMM